MSFHDRTNDQLDKRNTLRASLNIDHEVPVQYLLTPVEAKIRPPHIV